MSITAPLPAPPAPISSAAFTQRIRSVQAQLEKAGLDALAVNAGNSMRYFTGVPWDATERLVTLIIPRTGTPVVVCPHFETGSLKACLRTDVEIATWQEDENPALCALAPYAAGARIALDPDFSFGFVTAMRKARPDLVLEDDAGLISNMRACKSPEEIALITHAMAITLQVHKEAYAFLKPGLLASEIRRFIDMRHRALGADNGSYFCAVQFGHATAYPHGIPGDQLLTENDLVLIDTGCRLDGYHSDITRTYAFGQPDPEQARIWAIEKEAQYAAFNAAQIGAPCHVVDDAARAVLERHNLGPDYKLPGLPHRTGHGIGLSIHEAPYLVRGNTTPLKAGHCMSNEPMIVIPDTFGIRLEDHFYMTDGGPRWFTEPAHSFTAPFN
ncbi:Xaa-Pro peptidase family protein [Acetobacter cerevisiae]|uniref:X-Pro dipeptidase n=1 Tax=Acetobacter cerevisiae TaxID=178900 RepID=A0A149UUW1_9PROT|nr:Xaa-Pro peptidase family protein [Acetobacter cerevisiae]KXV71730.1 X-Pro dipeptidase [Acetobacter cerevisiae]MCP1246339.1 Xaa-Pro peptidase family protein [Acetobacter cerevisiae]MCP1255862.1 Xaa-Pro peptidase family protein [Acetobacter cerevisiae]